jgi:hypothetical protein
MSKGDLVTFTKHSMQPQRAIGLIAHDAESVLYTHPSISPPCPPPVDLYALPYGHARVRVLSVHSRQGAGRRSASASSYSLHCIFNQRHLNAARTLQDFDVAKHPATSQGRSMQDPGYELPRTSIPRNRVNKCSREPLSKVTWSP